VNSLFAKKPKAGEAPSGGLSTFGKKEIAKAEPPKVIQ